MPVMPIHDGVQLFRRAATDPQIGIILRPVSQQALQSLLLTCLDYDYGNAMLAGVPSNQLDRLQSVECHCSTRRTAVRLGSIR